MSMVGLFKGLLWVTHILYVLCFIPQIVTNYRRKSTAGMSAKTLFIYFIGYTIEIPCAYLLKLPLSMLIFVPAGSLVSIILAYQYFLYEKNSALRQWWRRMYSAAIAMMGLISFMGIWYPLFIGNMTGWIASFCFLIYQIPQVIKVHKRRSVDGFNFWFIVIIYVAALIEVLSAIIIPLPPQFLFNGARCLAFNIILNIYFNKYHPGRWYTWLISDW